MILTNPFDAPDAVRARAALADPLVMYLVVRREAVTSLDELLAAAAMATLRAEWGYAANKDYAADFAAWHAASFRKVTLRASEKDWTKLLTAYPDHALGGTAGAPVVAALPPRAKSAAGKLLHDLQAYVIAVSELPRAPISLDLARPVMLVAPNPAVTMSAGKLVAQVGHAALMSATAPAWATVPEPWRAGLAAWRSAGALVVPRFPSSAGWAAALAGLDGAAVTDSGLTEVAPGSRTVLALRPMAGPELRAAVATLAR
jgi:peptidyl-tRNA hydrolase